MGSLSWRGYITLEDPEWSEKINQVLQERILND
jgi:hypothetical protein